MSPESIPEFAIQWAGFGDLTSNTIEIDGDTFTLYDGSGTGGSVLLTGSLTDPSYDTFNELIAAINIAATANGESSLYPGVSGGVASSTLIDQVRVWTGFGGTNLEAILP